MVIQKQKVKFLISLPVLCLCFLWFLPLPAAAGPLQEVTIRQVHMYQDAMHAYVDLTDAAGESAAQPEANEVLAYLDDDKLGTRRIQPFSESGEAMSYIFLFDISGSLSNSQFAQMKEATIKWSENMGENDKVAIITFGSEVTTVLDFSSDKAAIQNAVTGISNSDHQTQLYSGIEAALKLAARNDAELPKRKAVLLLTDGLNDYNGGLTKEAVLNLVSQDVIPFYSLWSGGNQTGEGKEFLTTLSGESRGELYDLSSQAIQDIYNAAYENFQKAYVIDFSYPAAKADGSSHNLKISVREDGVEASDTRAFTVNPATENLATLPLENTTADTDTEKENGMSSIMILGIAAIILVLIAIVIILVAVLNRKKSEPKQTVGRQGYITPEMANIPKAEERTAAVRKESKNRGAQSASAAGIPLTLTRLGSGEEKRLKINKILTAGRSADCGLVLTDALVSGRHCTFYEEHGRLFVEDNASTNGTIVNGIKIQSRTELKSGDLILLGSDEYRIQFGG